jgi:hypothetical protein
MTEDADQTRALAIASSACAMTTVVASALLEDKAGHGAVPSCTAAISVRPPSAT